MFSNVVEWMFAEFWRYTILTFRILGWLTRQTISLTAGFLNHRQHQPSAEQANLLDEDRQR